MRKLFHHAAQQSHSECRRAAIGLVSDVQPRVVTRPVYKRAPDLIPNCFRNVMGCIR